MKQKQNTIKNEFSIILFNISQNLNKYITLEFKLFMLKQLYWLH